MIKINHSYTQDFLDRYEQSVITDRVIPFFRDNVLNAQGITQVDRSRIDAMFTSDFICDLVLCQPDQLYHKIVIIYSNLPILAERYCLEYYLKDISLTSEEALMRIQSKKAKDEIIQIHTRVIAELQVLSNTRQSILLPDIITNLQAARTPKTIKDQLKKINSIKLGNLVLTEVMKAQFPNWVNGFDNVFGYEAMSARFGREITTSMDLDICPYCNNEDIETISKKGAETRPDLDHFYPKAKFPFLAVTLSNLIPAGSRCNQKYKKAVSMFGYVNPYIRGINQNVLFEFYHTPGAGRNIVNLNIKTRHQNNELDKNMGLFRVEAVHNKSNVKNWFIDLEERYQLIINTQTDNIDDILNNDLLIRHRLDVDIHKSATKMLHQKLKIDALNFLSGRNYQMVD